MIYWNADPILLQLGPLAIHWYGVLFAGGFPVNHDCSAAGSMLRRG